MDHVITLGDVLAVGGVVLGVVVVAGIGLWILSIYASGWTH